MISAAGSLIKEETAPVDENQKNDEKTADQDNEKVVATTTLGGFFGGMRNMLGFGQTPGEDDTPEGDTPFENKAYEYKWEEFPWEKYLI